MSTPISVICDNCDKATTDWYAVGERWICGDCWDPFGEFDHRVTPVVGALLTKEAVV